MITSLATRRRGGFTLIELLTVIAIIAILAGLVLSTAGYVQKKAARARAEAEIAAMSAALESYKADNGTYPLPISQNKSDTGTLSQRASTALYQALSGDGTSEIVSGGSASDGIVDTGSKAYMEFNPSMLANTFNKVATSTTYLLDPFGNSYGYYAPATNDTTTIVYNPTFDLWSTSGTFKGSSEAVKDWQLRWVKNW